VLDGSPAHASFSAQLCVPATDVRLTVAGAGPISFPVRAPQAKRMIASARPARFGRGEQTLTDLSVRDTWEITPDQVTLTGLDWDAILAEARDELGLPARARPSARQRGDRSGAGERLLRHAAAARQILFNNPAKVDETAQPAEVASQDTCGSALCARHRVPGSQ
jgi:hypothetical protein